VVGGAKTIQRSYTSKDFTQTEYVTDTSTYRTGSAEYLPLAESLLAPRLLSPVPEIDNDVVLLKRKQDFGKTSLECVVLARKMQNLVSAPSALFPTYCFDPAMPILRWSGSYGQRNSLYNRILISQGRYIAGDLTISEDDNRPVLSVHIDALTALQSTGTDLAPPADAIRIETPGKVKVEQSVMQGSIIKKVMPQYPMSAKQSRIEGKVLVQAEIGEDGHIHEMKVLSAPDPSLAIAALLAVHQWEYKPYFLNGKPVRVQTQITVVYRLGG